MTDNELLAEFMNMPKVYGGYEKWDAFEIYSLEEFKFHASWDWLMPVVEKIEKQGFSFFIHNDGSYIRKTYFHGNFPDMGNTSDSKIESAYKSAIAFIKWHNSQSK